MASHNSPTTTCLWKKVLANPDSTTTQDTHLVQKLRCRLCRSALNRHQIACRNFIEVASE